MKLSRYVKIYPVPDAPGRFLLYSTKRGAVVRISEKTLSALETGTLTSAEQEPLERLGFLVPDCEEERRQMADRFVTINARSRRCSANVVLNLDCNLACTYCYEESIRATGRTMSPATADLLVATVVRDQIAHGRNVMLDFYGGEALLSVDLIRSIAGRIGAAARDNNVEFSFNLVTNGTLLIRRLAEELKELGLAAVKFTLDGPREVHDRFRPFVSGRGSFDVIFRNLLEVCDICSIQVGGNYTRDTYRKFPRLLDFFLESGLTPERLALVNFSPVIGRQAPAGVADFVTGCCSTGEPWLFDASLFLREEILKRGFNTPKPAPAACMVEFANDLVVNYDGSLYKCPAFIGWEGMQIGHLEGGAADYRESHNLDVWKKDECLDCAYLPLCHGGCRFMKLLRDGKIDDVDCQKELLDATLEGCLLQDLKYRPKKV